MASRTEPGATERAPQPLARGARPLRDRAAMGTRPGVDGRTAQRTGCMRYHGELARRRVGVPRGAGDR